MKSLLLIALLGMAGVMTGCCPPVKHSNTGRGIVRNVWQHTGGCYAVTFEREDGMTFVYDFANQAAVWTGMHATIDYTYNPSAYTMCPFQANAVQRWSDK